MYEAQRYWQLSEEKFMKLMIKTLVVLGLLQVTVAFADPTTGRPLGSSMNVELMDSSQGDAFGAGVGFEVGPQARVLISVEYKGHQIDEKMENEYGYPSIPGPIDSDYFNLRGRKSRLFWVSGTVGVSRDSNGQVDVPYANITVTPYTSLSSSKGDYSEKLMGAMSFLSTTYRRDVTLGEEHGVIVRALGVQYTWNGENENEAVSPSTFVPFVNLALDFAGWHFLRFMTDDGVKTGNMGFHYVGAEGQAGAALNLSNGFTARLTLGGRTDFNSIIGNMSNYVTGDVYARLTLALRKSFLKGGAYVQIGKRGFRGSEFAEEDSAVGQRGSDYLQFGVISSF